MLQWLDGKGHSWPPNEASVMEYLRSCCLVSCGKTKAAGLLKALKFLHFVIGWADPLGVTRSACIEGFGLEKLAEMGTRKQASVLTSEVLTRIETKVVRGL